MRRLIVLAAGGLTLLLVGIVSIALFMGAGTGLSGAAACGLTGGVRAPSGSILYPLPTGSYVLSSPFGYRWGTMHRGQDMAAVVGTEILAAADGRVVQAGPVSGFGHWIVLDHSIDGGPVSTVYGHMYASGVLVEVGDQVTAGQVIGAVGNDGESTGAHLHFEVWDGGRDAGRAVDPMPWLTTHATAVLPVVAAAGSDLLPTAPSGPQARLTVDAEVSANVATIVGVAKGAGLSLRAAVIAVATSAQEAGVHNLDYGDRDSVGLFQQRTTSGWGSIEQIMDPVLGAQAFYGVAEHTSNTGLIDITDWATIPLTQAADAVQRSAFPNGYAQWEQQAAELVEAARDSPPIDSPRGELIGAAECAGARADGVLGGAGFGPIIPADLTVGTSWPAEQATVDDPTSTGLITGRTAALLADLQNRGFTGGGVLCWDPHPQNPTSDHPRGQACDVFFDPADPAQVAQGWELANWVVAEQASYGVASVIWQGQSWSPSSPTAWVTYRSSVYGCPDPANLTGCHFDHVHISVF